jgi:hypothetical protein
MAVFFVPVNFPQCRRAGFGVGPDGLRLLVDELLNTGRGKMAWPWRRRL